MVRSIFLNEIRTFCCLFAQGDYDGSERLMVLQGLGFMNKYIHIPHCFGEIIHRFITTFLFCISLIVHVKVCSHWELSTTSL
jgi:hypothetical protein